MDSITAKWLQHTHATETAAEYAVRATEAITGAPLPPPEERATVLLRMWMQPDAVAWVRQQHLLTVTGEIAEAEPRAWRLTWSSVALFAVAGAGADAAADTPGGVPAAVALAILGVLLVGAGLGGAMRLARAAGDPMVPRTRLAHLAWERAEPLDHEDAAEWGLLHERVSTYVTLCDDVSDAAQRPLLSRASDAPAEAMLVEEIRLHLRSAAIALRQHHGAWDGYALAAGEGDGVLAAVPRIQAEHAHADFTEYLARADDALEALRPLALAARVSAKLAPLGIPLPQASGQRALRGSRNGEGARCLPHRTPPHAD
ncbi:Uncharacterised protein (plasmid) [Tsukamurella tyrosinosolvens]|uniref:Uncharacterized protein n=1 Tax=Tsukamurella tyrosinosolvens TaxID=57704 RepID=A0A1H4U3Y7_TSUTY|nr:hypothetical protein [Tsukamurella tyrosinosolvens]KXO93033.1 hypothetical protein AXK58_14275 [Tsukamurella tyrosinosolvens]SEC62954.1 hypothetical protein SAMN04489793_2775 [Tsukamurella tyrosinosolvens]VEH93976.1 Uncharacterised protein [Tsukamurella tyrosinosolvens]